MLELLRSPKAFPCFIMFVYACTSIRWFVAKNPWQGSYWIVAMCLTFIVTFGNNHDRP